MRKKCIRIKYFGEVAELTGKSAEELNLQTADAESLSIALQEAYGLDISQYHIALNHDIVQLGELGSLQEGDELALLSAFAGG